MSKIQMHLTSPHMRGLEIKTLQILLSAHGYYHGASDGEFALLTYQAVYRAKYWLGYWHPNHVAGDRLVAILSGTKKTTPAERARALLRQRKRKQVSKGQLLLKEARTHLRTKESPPGSNKVSFSIWYGLIGSWCAMFISFCGVKVGIKSFKKGVHYAYVPFLEADARAGRNGLVLVHPSQVGPGMLVLYDWPGESPGIADHIGVFDEWITPGVHFWAIEGNTAVGNDSNGGEVMRRDRSVSNVKAFVKVT